MGMFKDFLFEPDEEEAVEEKGYASEEEEIFNAVANINVYAPESLKEMIKPADALKYGDTIILNFSKVEKIVAQRCIDFVFGIVYALNGKMTKIDEDIFLCTPKTIKVGDERND